MNWEGTCEKEKNLEIPLDQLPPNVPYLLQYLVPITVPVIKVLQ